MATGFNGQFWNIWAQEFQNASNNFNSDQVKVYKEWGNDALNKNDLAAALHFYNSAIGTINLFPTDPGVYAEYHIVLCNRSLVLFRLERYREAEQDAQLAIIVCGTYIKGYWRAGQAAFHDPNDPNGAYRALEYFANGLKVARRNEHGDVTLFLAEICRVAAERPNTEGLTVLLQAIELPDAGSEHVLWENVLVRLSKKSKWKVIAMLFNGRNGPNPHRLCTLDTSSWDCTKLSVQTLLTDLETTEIKAWGEQLALLLVKQSASFENTTTTDSSNNSVIFFVQTALKISSTELLKLVLAAYKDMPEKINAHDKNGCTAVHIVAAAQNVDTTFLASVLKLLLDANADLGVVDKSNKTPSDYVQNNDTLKQIFHYGLNSDLIIHQFEELKTQGNNAKKGGNYEEALRKYDEALGVAQISPALYKKAAIIYSNKANVLFAQEKYDEALDNALAAVNSDECYVKAYWWVAKTLRISGDKSREEVILYLLKGYHHSGNIKDKADFIENIVLYWKEMNDEHIDKTIEELRLHEVKEEELEVTLERLSKNAEWKSIALMILGTKLTSEQTHEGKRFKGIAGSCSTAKVHAHTIIDYLKSADYNPKRDGIWLDAVLYAIFHNGYGKGPSHIHTAAKFAANTGRTAFLKAIPAAKDISKERNEAGDSVFHVLAKFKPPPEEKTFIRIVKPFIEKGYSTVLENSANMLAVEFLDNSFSASVCDLFLPAGFRANASTARFFFQRIDNRLIANTWEDAEALCNILSAISREIILATDDYVFLHYAMADSYFGRQRYEDSLKESLEIIKLDQKCFEGHFFAARAFAKLNRFLNAIDEYIEAYNIMAQPEKLQVQRQDQHQSQLAVLQELTCLCSKRNSPALDGVVQRLNIKDKTSVIWAITTYNLINSDMAGARNAFNQFEKSKELTIQHFGLDFKPLCNLEKIKEHGWMMDILQYFIDCTNDISTISCEEGDTPIHALVRMSLISKNLRPMKTVLNRGDGIFKDVKRFDESLIHKLDSKGNTPLHIAAMERKVQKEIRVEVVRILIEAGVDVDKENSDKWTAIKSTQLDKECKSILLAASKFRQSANRTCANPHAAKPPKYKRNETSGEINMCKECRSLLKNIITSLQEDNFKGGSELIKRLFKKQHKTPVHTNILEEAIKELINYLKASEITAIPNHLKFVGKDNIEKLITELFKNESFNTAFLLDESYRSWFSNQKLTEFNIEPLVESPHVGQDFKIAALKRRERHWIFGRENGKFCVQSALLQKQYGVVEELVKRGADITFLTVYQGDTPIHAWMQTALTENAPDLFDSILKRYYSDTENNFCLNPEQQDENGDSLFHLIAKANYTESSQRITEYLCNTLKPVSASYVNKQGKRPRDYLKKCHKRLVRFFEMAANENTSDKSVQGGFKPEASKDQLKGSMATQKASMLKHTSIKQTAIKQVEIMIRNLPQFMNDINKEQMITDNDAYTKSGFVNSTEQDHITTSKADDGNTNKKSLNAMNMDAPNADKYQTPSATKRKQTRTLEEIADHFEKDRNLESDMETLPEEDDSEPPPLETDEDIERRHDLPGQYQNIPQESFHCTKSEEDKENASVSIHSLRSEMFDGCTFEVEFTRNVFKVLRDRHVEEGIKARIVRDIIKLASGDWEKHLCKPLEHSSPTLRLYEAKISKAYRIIWELAVSFSYRLSKHDDKEQSFLYADKIRIWDIVLDHDKIQSSVKKIVDAYRRGNTCVLKRSLKSLKTNTTSAGNHPNIYTVKNSSDNPLPDKEIVVYPPASDNDKEFHILKFHSFDSSIISLAVQSMDVDVDLPIEVSEKEFTVINIKSNQAILLMGRSGTGKTTCLLYRLWDRFFRHWSIPQEDETDSEDFEAEIEQNENKDTNENKVDDLPLEDRDKTSVISCKSSQEYNLRQLFITKNAVLTTEVRKSFNSFRNIYCKKDKLRINEASTEELPNRLQDITDSSYPLFLTSKQYLLLLDASLENPFFERHDDGSVKARVDGWTNTEDSVVNILDNDFDTDEEIDNDDKASQDGEEPADLREVTYEVFVNEFWPKVKHEISQKHTSYHVSLIWMEIISFIQGSYKCLFNDSGHLSLEDYERVGKKKAYNFDGKREEVYEIFKQYKRWKKSCKRFDETDVVRHIFRRLDSVDSSAISVHQIYVDETQDFTEVELYLLIRLCRNPNDMFFTGDTAQSIMRGVAFRFKDLKTLFHEAKTYVEKHNKTSQRKLPSVFVPEEIHQLQYNYRSHSGISSLASSVLDILVRFFPESFDRLEPDQGLFDGPKPLFIESCDFSDLAVLLSGNKRETSNIEFGAHQVILVVDEAARNALPVELSRALTLTIYESKGLEFDDVLLFNFFKDSQANNEWRVVMDLIKEHAIKQQEKFHEHKSEVACLDTDFLQSKDMPRPLPFDQNLHKVLNSELKHLYTALTRARANIFIFDGDREKRAPMFEYFKFRNLVDIVTVEGGSDNTKLSRLVQQSSPEEWTKQGDKYMKKFLYGPAAKCYSLGNNKTQENLALANELAVSANKKHKQTSKIEEDFVCAAEMYLMCNEHVKAAKCLKNAKEFDLAIQLFEKLGMLEDAAEIYKKQKKYIECSECYQRADLYNKAVRVLFDNQLFDRATDTLKLYEMRKQKLEQQEHPRLGHVLQNKPADIFTEEKISKRAADHYHETKNKERMFEAVNRFSCYDDRVRFLEKHGYIEEAVYLMEQLGKFPKAVDVCVKNGKFEKARELTDKCTPQTVIAENLLKIAKGKLWAQQNAYERKEDKDRTIIDETGVISDLEKAERIFVKQKDADNLGQVLLLQAIFRNDPTLALSAMNKFSEARNAAGEAECCFFLQSFMQPDNIDIISAVTKKLDSIFSLCNIWIEGERRVNFMTYCTFYGIFVLDKDTFVIYPHLGSFCLPAFATQYVKQRSISKDKVCHKMAHYLMKKGQTVANLLKETLLAYRNSNRVCNYVTLGTKCIENLCPMKHEVETKESLKQLLNADMLLMMFEATTNRRLNLQARHKQFRMNESIMLNETYKFQACFYFYEDFMPVEGFSSLRTEEMGSVLQLLMQQENNKVRRHIIRQLKDKWELDTSKQNLQCRAVFETDIFLKLQLFYHTFRLKDLSAGVLKTPIQEITDLESAIDKTLVGKSFENEKNNRQLTVMFQTHSEDKPVIRVLCLGRKFVEAYDFLYQKQPYDALVAFSNFQIELSSRQKTKDTSLLPDASIYISWLELFTALSLLLMTKLCFEENVVCTVPNSFLHLMRTMDNFFPETTSIFQSVEEWILPDNKQQVKSDIQYRLGCISNVISGYEQGVNLMTMVQKESQTDFRKYALLERCLILGMTMLCNFETIMPVENKSRLIDCFKNLNVPEKAPQRLKKALTQFGSARCTKDIAGCLNKLTMDRNEKVVLCAWEFGQLSMDFVERTDRFSEAFIQTTQEQGNDDNENNEQYTTSTSEEETATRKDIKDDENFIEGEAVKVSDENVTEMNSSVNGTGQTKPELMAKYQEYDSFFYLDVAHNSLENIPQSPNNSQNQDSTGIARFPYRYNSDTFVDQSDIITPSIPVSHEFVREQHEDDILSKENTEEIVSLQKEFETEIMPVQAFLEDNKICDINALPPEFITCKEEIESMIRIKNDIGILILEMHNKRKFGECRREMKHRLTDLRNIHINVMKFMENEKLQSESNEISIDSFSIENEVGIGKIESVVEEPKRRKYRTSREKKMERNERKLQKKK